MRILFLVIAVNIFSPLLVKANDAEPWGIKHWVIGASLEGVGITDVAHNCESDDLDRTYCEEKPVTEGGYPSMYPETVARYPAKITSAKFWHGAAVRIDLTVAGRTNGLIPPLTEKLGASPEVRKVGDKYTYTWRNQAKETMIVIASGVWDYFLIEIQSPKYWDMLNAGRSSDKEHQSHIDRAGDI